MRYVGKYTCIALLTLAFNAAFAQPDTSNKFVPWEIIKDENILWKKRVWRQINIYEKNNRALTNDPKTPKENVFPRILLYGLRTGALKAYRDGDTAFTEPLGIPAIDSAIQCDPAGLSRLSRSFLNTLAGRLGDTMTPASCNFPDQVDFYNIVEDWMFDKERGLMVVRILAIAPAAYVNKKIKPLFWLYYPEARQYFSHPAVFKDGENLNISWEEYFESRQFSSKITKAGRPFSNTDAMDAADNSKPPGNKAKAKKHKKKRQKTQDNIFTDRDKWVY